MRLVTASLCITTFVLAATIGLGAQGAAKKAAPAKAAPAAAAPAHSMATPGEMKWGPAPPALPAGAQIAVLDGDPGKAAPFVMRLKFPDGYKIPPHWHSGAENITTISGTFMMGLGDKYDAAAMHTLPAGSFAMMPKEGRHYATVKGETIVQIHGTGPFDVNYINPADDPSKKK
jgi:anti-sigma factor ChrR (cupin superfamily)